MSSKTNDVAGKIEKAKSDVVWEIEDRFSRAMAHRIRTPDGEPTKFAMVYGWANSDGGSNADGHWEPVRPVSDRYKPILTGEIVDMAIERLGGAGALQPEKLRTDRFGTSLEVKLPLDRPITVPGRPFDRGHVWTRNGSDIGTDVIYPVVNIRNAYDATSSIVVDVGWFRMICSNGAKVMIAGMGSRAIHTVNEVARVLDEVAQADWKGDIQVIEQMTKKTFTKKMVTEIAKSLPHKYREEYSEYVRQGDNTAWAAMNGLSYMQSHVYTLSRSRQLDGVMRRVQELAIAA